MDNTVLCAEDSSGTTPNSSHDVIAGGDGDLKQAIAMPTPASKRHDWYQTETHVVITLLIKNVQKDDLLVDVRPNSLSVTVRLSSGSDYSLELDLAHRVVPEQSQTKIMPSKVELKLKKEEGHRWISLEYTGSNADLKQFNPGSSGDGTGASALKYPSSSQHRKDWDAIVVEVKKEEKEEKPEGDAAVNQLFQQIYGDGSDEVRRAMNKSFSESGGTVLSTNWGEVKKGKVEVKPPDGMEFKKYDI